MGFPNGLDGPVDPEQQDPIISALLAGGYPVQRSAPPAGSPPGTSDLVYRRDASAPAPAPTPPQTMEYRYDPTKPQPTPGPGDVQLLGAGGPQGPITSPTQAPAAPAPTTPATAPPDAAYTPPLTPLRSGDVKGANAAQETALENETKNVMSTELAKVDALAQHADKRAQIYEGHAQAQQLIDEQYQKARDKARMDANAETAAWMRDLDKKVAEEPVPGRWWANQSKFGQVMYLASLAFGAMAQAKNPNLKNIALEMITKETEEDMAEQRQRINHQIEALKMKGQVIDQKLRAQIEDSKDDHTLLVSRLAIMQQAALERANAPGSADVKAAMAEAAQWAGQQRLTIAGERANRAYAEREGQLNRDAEMSRALLTDKRDRDIAAANIQKDYDLANIKASLKDDPRIKDAVVLNPETTGIRVVGENGAPVATPISSNGGLTVSKANEKEARQTAEMAAEKFAAMKRVSAELGKGESLNILLKRNPQLISDIVKLGYGAARNELDPNGRVTDKDFVAGLENQLGGDLETLSGRVASMTFSASPEKLKELVDKHIRDYPKFVSHKLGSLIDAAIPGYEGKVRVDWTPKSVETSAPSTQSTQEIDASYGIKNPIKPPQTVGDLETAQQLEKKGITALPPYRAGSEDKVLKALADFKGALPSTIIDRAGAMERQLSEAGDSRASLEVQQAQYAEVKRANKRLAEIDDALKAIANPQVAGPGGSMQNRGYEGNKAVAGMTDAEKQALDRGEIPVHTVVDIANAHGITQLTGQDVLDIIKKVGLKPFKE